MNHFTIEGQQINFLKPNKILQYCNPASLLFCSVMMLPLCLTGCMGVYEGGFECPPGKGVGCKSISEVNEMINQGVIPPAQSSVFRTHSSEEVQEELGANDAKNSSCHSHSCPSAPAIWYAPWFRRVQKENQKTKVWDGKTSI